MYQSDYVDFIARIRQGNPSPGGLSLLRQSLHGISPLTSDAKILEIGSNTGSSLAALAEMFPTQSIIGIDISPKMTEVAKEYINDLQESGLLVNKNVLVKTDDAQNLAFSNETFDLIVSGGTLSFVEDRESAVKEMERVLKPGGYLLSLEYCYKEDITPPQDLQYKITNLLEFDVSRLNLTYWNNIHLQGSLYMEGLQVFKPYIHRAKNVKNTVDSVSDYLQRGNRTLSDNDRSKLSESLNLFIQNEQYLLLAVYTMRKLQGTKLLMDVVN
ncbi:class I SAM-dependent methyltransferase [Paenibacillus polymyxa]|uniref:class I SAM-dependent methyltransferase n=1 Tax=Paenibacillus polymyxa TaxID=1406 RepID=UPI001BE6EFAC|nr:class I SAM-dependent methyltransferase [Paenibacillus polymyxa]MBT2282181.1 class I SAM-dependent methyltransferase [Paenibacillus polymyxa]